MITRNSFPPGEKKGSWECRRKGGECPILVERVSASRCRLIASNKSSKVSASCSNASVQEEEIMAMLLGSDPCTAGKRRNCNSNIVTTFAASKITGQGFSRGTQVRETTRNSTENISQRPPSETRDLRCVSCPMVKTLSWASAGVTVATRWFRISK